MTAGTDTASPVGCDLVVSAENNDYMAWQCMVLHHSAITTLDQHPIFVVHGDEPDLVSGFEQMQAAGAHIQRAPNFRHDGLMYAPRNQMKTIELVESDAAWIMLLDPDMIFLDAMDPAVLAAQMDDRMIGLDRISFLHVGANNRHVMSKVCAHAGLPLQQVEDHPISGAPPYLIPNAIRPSLLPRWQSITEKYLTTAYRHHGGYHSEVWISVMWGLVLAIHSLDLEPRLFELCMHTADDPSLDSGDHPILHYSYDTEDFVKRRYNSAEQYDELWALVGRPGHTSGAVCDAIRAAGRYYEAVRV